RREASRTSSRPRYSSPSARAAASSARSTSRTGHASRALRRASRRPERSLRCATSRRSRSDGYCAATASREPLGERVPARGCVCGLHHRGGPAVDRLRYVLAARDGPVDARPPRVPPAGHLLLDGRGHALRGRGMARAARLRGLVYGGGVGRRRGPSRDAHRACGLLCRATRAPGWSGLVDLAATRRRGAARLQDHLDRPAAALHAGPFSRAPRAAPFLARWLLATVAHPPAAFPRVDEPAWWISPRPRGRRDLRGRGRPHERTARAPTRS